MADDEGRVVAGVDDGADGCVEAGEELLAGLAAGHPVGEVALEPGGDGPDVAGDGVVVGAHLELAGLDLLEAFELGERQAAVLGGRRRRLVRTHPAGDVDRVEVLVGERPARGDGLGAAEVGEVEAGVGGVELARDVGMGLAVPHQQQSHQEP